MTFSFADVVRNVKKVERQGVEEIVFSSEAEVKASFTKSYVGVVHNLGSLYNIQERLFSEGYYAIKVTPMGPNMCLLEESEEGEICDLICEAESWWNQWFQVSDHGRK